MAEAQATYDVLLGLDAETRRLGHQHLHGLVSSGALGANQLCLDAVAAYCGFANFNDVAGLLALKFQLASADCGSGTEREVAA